MLSTWKMTDDNSCKKMLLLGLVVNNLNFPHIYCWNKIFRNSDDEKKNIKLKLSYPNCRILCLNMFNLYYTRLEIITKII